MSCVLQSKLDAAITAAKEAFDEAHSKDSLSANDTNLLFVYYQGFRKIKEGLPDHSTHDDTIVLPDGCYDPDYNVNTWADYDASHLNFNVNLPEGNSISDVITFTSGTDTVTVPEHEDDEKIVL